MTRKIQRLFVYVLVNALLSLGFAQSAQATMVATEQVVTAGAAGAAEQRSRISAALNQPDIIAELEKRGVSKEEANARIGALSDDEAAALAEKIDSLPAGGDSLLGALVFIFVLLLITDILGLTKIFPFTRAQR